jgi:transcriptional regulator with XRE-family HTH domain
MKRTYKIIGLAMAVATVAAIAGTSVLAQSPTPEATQLGQRPAIGQKMIRPGMGGFFQGRGGDANEAIATALGISVEELAQAREDGQTVADLAELKGVALQSVKDAVEAARLEQARAHIEAQVEAGRLTRERADWMLQGLNADWGKGMADKPADTGLQAAAEILGMSLDELQLQMWGGRTLEALAERAGVEPSTVTDAVKAAQQEAMRERLAEAVAAGRMTQEQADWLLQGMEKGYAPGGRGLPSRGRPGMGGMRCGPMGGKGAQPEAEAGTSA